LGCLKTDTGSHIFSWAQEQLFILGGPPAKQSLWLSDITHHQFALLFIVASYAIQILGSDSA
jgi:hypothetical protein